MMKVVMQAAWVLPEMFIWRNSAAGSIQSTSPEAFLSHRTKSIACVLRLLRQIVLLSLPGTRQQQKICPQNMMFIGNSQARIPAVCSWHTY
jgi:hypothetical protein